MFGVIIYEYQKYLLHSPPQVTVEHHHNRGAAPHFTKALQHDTALDGDPLRIGVTLHGEWGYGCRVQPSKGNRSLFYNTGSYSTTLDGITKGCSTPEAFRLMFFGYTCVT